ncbi:hypothetical protein [Tistrella mobilis]|uniref:hypothetical protein n=1 Tax=Tistrella mobilis TaxID=171437 RepID=UPI0011AE31C9|nr:hypothetical protein [Tistrella mobilis]
MDQQYRAALGFLRLARDQPEIRAQVSLISQKNDALKPLVALAFSLGYETDAVALARAWQQDWTLRRLHSHARSKSPVSDS